MSDHAQSDPHPRERLLALARQRRVSLAALSDMIGRNPAYLQQFVSRGSPRRLSERDRRVLADFFAVSESELGGEKENSYNRRENAARPAAPHGSGGLSGGSSDGAAGAAARDAGLVLVPRLSLAASAGPGAVSTEEVPFDSFGFSRRWLREQGLDGATLSAIAVEGDSMEPLLRAGDEVLVDHAPQNFRDGIHVVRLDDTLLVKRVAAQGKGRFALLSHNPAYPPIEVRAQDVEIIGRVVWKSGRV